MPNKSVKTPIISTKRENKSKKLHSEVGELAQTGSQSSMYSFCISAALPKEVVGILLLLLLLLLVLLVSLFFLLFLLLCLKRR